MTTEERLAKLERELGRVKRRSRWLMAALVLGLGALVLVWALAGGPPSAETPRWAEAPPITRFAELDVLEVRAQRLVLVDDEGKVRATLGPASTIRAILAADKGPRLSLYDAAGKERVTLSVTADGPRLDLFDAEGKGRAGLVVFKDVPNLSLWDEASRCRASLAMTADGPGLTLFDAAGKGRATLGAGQIVLPDGKIVSYTESSMRLFGPNGNMTWQAPWSAP